jgi:hypothetical protein
MKKEDEKHMRDCNVGCTRGCGSGFRWVTAKLGTRKKNAGTAQLAAQVAALG